MKIHIAHHYSLLCVHVLYVRVCVLCALYVSECICACASDRFCMWLLRGRSRKEGGS